MRLFDLWGFRFPSLPSKGEGRGGGGPGSGAHRTMLQLAQERIANASQVLADFTVPDTEQPIARSLKEVGAPLLTLATLLEAMVHAINLHDQAPLETDEIDCERSNRMLTSEAKTTETMLAQLCPQDPLLLGGILSQRPCSALRHLTPHPVPPPQGGGDEIG